MAKKEKKLVGWLHDLAPVPRPVYVPVPVAAAHAATAAAARVVTTDGICMGLKGNDWNDENRSTTPSVAKSCTKYYVYIYNSANKNTRKRRQSQLQ